MPSHSPSLTSALRHRPLHRPPPLQRRVPMLTRVESRVPMREVVDQPLLSQAKKMLAQQRSK